MERTSNMMVPGVKQSRRNIPQTRVIVTITAWSIARVMCEGRATAASLGPSQGIDTSEFSPRFVPRFQEFSKLSGVVPGFFLHLGTQLTHGIELCRLRRESGFLFLGIFEFASDHVLLVEPSKPLALYLLLLSLASKSFLSLVSKSFLSRHMG